MARGKPRPPAARTPSRAYLSNVETEETSRSGPEEDERPRANQVGEAVPIPSKELMGSRGPDWGKWGFWAAVVTFALSIAGAAVWQFATTAESLRSIGDDVKDLKKRADEQLRSSIEAFSRISSLERQERAASPSQRPASSPESTSTKR